MSPQLRKSIQKFLVDVDNPTNDLGREAYLYNSLQTALNFLRMAVVEDYKIPEDTSWTYTKPIPEIEKISVMNLKPDDILVFSTDFKIPSSAYSRIDQKITDWKNQNNIINKHLILTSLKLEVLSKEQAANFKDKQ